MNALGAMIDYADALRAYAIELEQDAKRYRWICDENGYFMEEQGLCGHSNEKAMADEMIDNAIELERKG